jgi:ATP-binding cassette, subfamily B, bacterial
VPELSRDSFERTFPRREWWSGLGRTALLWSVLNGLLLCLLLLEAGLLVGLWVDRGQLTVQLVGAEAEQFARISGLIEPPAVPQPADDDAVAEPAGEAADEAAPDAPAVVPAVEPAVPDPVPLEISRRFEDAGLLPAVWRARHSWWGGGLAAAYRSLPALRHNQSALTTLLLLGAATWLAMVWCQAQLRFTCRNAALEVSARLWRQLHRQAMRLETEDLDGAGVAGTQALFVTDIERIRTNLYQWLYRSSRYRWELLFLIVAACSVEVLLTVQWTLLSILGWYVISRSQPRATHALDVARDRAQRELHELAESLRAARLVRGYGMDTQETEQFQTRLSRYVNEIRTQNQIEDNPLWLRLMAGLAGAVVAVFLLFLLGLKVLSQDVSPPGALVFLVAFTRGLRSVKESRQLPEWRTATAVSAAKIWRYLDLLPTVSQAVGAKFLQPLSKTLHWESVTYRPPGGRLLLDRLDLQVRAGRTYSVVSLDEREARAFAFLLPRFIEPQSGRVLFDGEDIAWGTLESLRAEVVLATADDPLLSGTVLDNIRAGRSEITLNQATEAAKEARAHNFIARLPQGYETELSLRDAALDAGQRFRLSLARALVRKPAVLIIEEPAEELDDDTKQLIDDTYGRICPGRTVFFLPRRLSAVRSSDDVIVLRQGRVEAFGPHAVLVKESPLYRHWEYVHFHEFRRDGQA